MEQFFMGILREFGVPLGLVVFFIWRDFMREKYLNTRMTEIETYQRDKLEKLTVESNKVLAKNTIVLEEVLVVLRKATHGKPDNNESTPVPT